MYILFFLFSLTYVNAQVIEFNCTSTEECMGSKGELKINGVKTEIGKTVHTETGPIHTNPSRADISDSESIQEKYNKHHKLGIPVILSESAMKTLNLKGSECIDFKKNIENCSYYKCVKETSFIEVKLGLELIVHGLNSSQNCAISIATGKRYFVPKADLKYFFPLVEPTINLAKLPKPLNEQIEASTDPKIPTKIMTTVVVKEKKCQIQVEYFTVLDKSNLIQASAKELSKYPQADRSRQVILEGKSYYPKTQKEVLNYRHKYKTLVLLKGSDPICESNKAKLLFELDNKGLVSEFNVVHVGTLL